MDRERTTRIVAGALSAVVWAVAAPQGYALETIWLPAVVLGAGWAPRSRRRACRDRIRLLRGALHDR